MRGFELKTGSKIFQLLCVFVLLYIVYLISNSIKGNVVNPKFQIDLPWRSQTNRSGPKSITKCLDGNLFATSVGAGLGNKIFEVLAYIAIAEKTERLPVIGHKPTLEAVEKMGVNFPNLKTYLEEKRIQSFCRPYDVEVASSIKCCIYDNNFVDKIANSTADTVRATFYYTQGTKYIGFVSPELVLRLMEGSQTIKQFTEDTLFPRNKNRIKRTNICVHVRRGDFVNNAISLPSEGNFSALALQHIRSKERFKDSDVYVMSNDQAWSRNIFKGANFANSSSQTPPNAEWEFSKKYCDCVLLTASVSTYGWWIAYLSRGQTVYYNKDFSTPNGIENDVKAKDFWPANWTSLQLVNNSRIIEAKVKIS